MTSCRVVRSSTLIGNCFLNIVTIFSIWDCLFSDVMYSTPVLPITLPATDAIAMTTITPTTPKIFLTISAEFPLQDGFAKVIVQLNNLLKLNLGWFIAYLFHRNRYDRFPIGPLTGNISSHRRVRVRVPRDRAADGISNTDPIPSRAQREWGYIPDLCGFLR
jgi:hypothetical protein